MYDEYKKVLAIINSCSPTYDHIEMMKSLQKRYIRKYPKSGVLYTEISRAVNELTPISVPREE